MRSVTVKPVHLAAAAVLVVGSWGGATFAAASDGSAEKAPVTNARGGANAPLVYKTKTFVVPANSFNNGIATCPAGYKVVGGGVSPEGVTATVNDTRPYDKADADSVPDDAWIAYVINPDGVNINATTYAVCKRN